jgi:lipopolysaccharide/colanic/teichoic acid biosynthesis glycosyltransferase
MILLLIAVAIPSLLVFLGFVTVESEQAILNSAVSAALATAAGLISLRRINDFPGVRSYAFILPSFAAAFGIALALILGLRLSYSRTVLTASFLLTVPTTFVLVYLSERLTRLQFHLVPGGDVETLRTIEEADWRVLAKPRIPANPHAVLVADFRHNHDDEWERLLAHAAIHGHVVYHSKLLRESLSGEVSIEHLSENSFGSLVPNLAYRKIKRVIDVLGCLLLAPLLLVPMICIAALIKLDSRGPVIFRQQRVGFRGEVFEMFKFRSMHPRDSISDEHVARQDAMTRTGDDRITRVGRILRLSRLDELPQIINILRGDMSWIGPRPEAVPLSKWYENEIPFYTYRHIIRPGISGWAQVQQGHVTDLDAVHKKLKYDFYYIKNFSAWLDLVIMMRTLPTMVRGLGAR